jgi:hypothetical protein
MFSNVEFLRVTRVVLDVIGCDCSQEGDIVTCVKHGHFDFTGLVGSIYVHMSIQVVTDNKLMRHLYPLGFHGMPFPIIVTPDVRLVEISDTPGSNVSPCGF